MEAEAPEKIYLIRNISTSTALNTCNDCHEKYLQEWYKEREKDADVEYTRTDAFVEKAISYIQQHWIWNTKIIDDFRKYMKGE